MNLTYIQIKILMWADWRVRRDNGGLGYPKKCAFVRTTSGGGFWTPEMDSECYAVDQQISALAAERKQIILVYYTQIGTHEQKAFRCGVSLSTFKRRIAEAEAELSKLLGYKVQTSAHALKK